MLQRVIRGVQQLRGACPTRQVAGAEVALCSRRGLGGAVHRRDGARKGTTVTLLEPQPVEHPAAPPLADSRPPTGTAVARGELLFQRCGDCGRSTHTPAVVSAHCGSHGAVLGAERPGGARVYSWTVVWRPQTPVVRVPYAPIIVELEEGWQMLSNMVGCEHDAVYVGQAVEVVFHAHAGGVTLPYFQPRPVADG